MPLHHSPLTHTRFIIVTKAKTTVSQTKQMEKHSALDNESTYARDCEIKPNVENNSRTEMSKWLNLFIQPCPKKQN